MRAAGKCRASRWRCGATPPRSATAWRAPGGNTADHDRRDKGLRHPRAPRAGGRASTGASSPGRVRFACPKSPAAFRWPGHAPTPRRPRRPGARETPEHFVRTDGAADALRSDSSTSRAPGKALNRASSSRNSTRAAPNSVRMTKESVNAYAAIGAHAASHMAHDQMQLAAASSRSARGAQHSRLGTRRERHLLTGTGPARPQTRRRAEESASRPAPAPAPGPRRRRGAAPSRSTAAHRLPEKILQRTARPPCVGSKRSTGAQANLKRIWLNNELRIPAPARLDRISPPTGVEDTLRRSRAAV